jgi:hypothetical protein
MKYLSILILLFLWITSCNSPSQIEPETEPDDIVSIEADTEEAIAECGTDNPQENLPWLKALIEKAKTDQTGHYVGTIWLVSYKGKDIFVTNMGLGSGGIMYWFFDCSGNHLDVGSAVPSPYIGDGLFTVEDREDLELYVLGLRLHENKDIPVIYSNIPL